MDFNEIYEILMDGLKMPISYFTHTGKRLNIIYLLSSMFLAFYVYRTTKIKSSFFKYIFNKKIWASKSAIVDYFLIFFNSFVKILLIGPYLIFGLQISFYFNEFLLSQFGYPTNSLGVTQTLVLYTIVLTLVGDFTTYVVHFIMHRVSFLWEFHKIHHSATSLNPVTQYRIHPIELIINNIRSTIVFGLVMGFFDYLSQYEVQKVMFLGANVFSFIFLFWGANLRHSHVKLKYFNFLEYIFISPYQHQIHHSNNPDHFDKNMGSKLAIWDWMFGTLVVSKAAEKIEFGLGHEDVNYTSISKNLYMPFKNIFISIKSLFYKL